MLSVTAALLVTMLAGTPQAARRPSAIVSDSATIVRVLAAYDSAWARKDTAAVRRIMSPRYQYFSSLGGVNTLDETLEFLARPDYRLDYVQRSEVAVTIDGAAAVVSSRWVGRGSWAEGEIDDDQRCGLVFVWAESGWRLLAEHCVQIADSD